MLVFTQAAAEKIRALEARADRAEAEVRDLEGSKRAMNPLQARALQWSEAELELRAASGDDVAAPPRGTGAGDAAPPREPTLDEIAGRESMAGALLDATDGRKSERWRLTFLIFVQVYTLVAAVGEVMIRIPFLAGLHPYLNLLIAVALVCFIIEVVTMPLLVRASRAAGFLRPLPGASRDEGQKGGVELV